MSAQTIHFKSILITVVLCSLLSCSYKPNFNRSYNAEDCMIIGYIDFLIDLGTGTYKFKSEEKSSCDAKVNITRNNSYNLLSLNYKDGYFYNTAVSPGFYNFKSINTFHVMLGKEISIPINKDFRVEKGNILYLGHMTIKQNGSLYINKNVSDCKNYIMSKNKKWLDHKIVVLDYND